MSNPILTPISLWRGFNESIPENFQADITEEREKDGLLYRETEFNGRQTAGGFVRIYGVEVRPNTDEPLPALLLLTTAKRGVDVAIAERFARRGYCVFCMDYRGECADALRFTRYPADIDYANYLRVGRTIYHADNGAQKTAWYEWTAAARFAVAYLKTLPYITSVGAMGMREGGDIVWKLMTMCELSCGICINAVGWLAYGGVGKFAEESSMELTEEQRLFIAGLDSQSYAPFVKCPVLMLVSLGDSYSVSDRAYDTFVRINKEQFSSIHYSITSDGLIDKNGVKDADMFMDKYLKKREIFLAEPPAVSLQEENDEPCAVVSFRGQGEVTACEVYFSESIGGEDEREWTQCARSRKNSEGETVFPLQLYGGASLFLFVRTQYSSGFVVSSKILYQSADKKYANAETWHTNILYDSEIDGEIFATAESQENVLGDCLKADEGIHPQKMEGYGKISGMGCPNGLKTYRISHPRYAPNEKSLLHFNVYSAEDCKLTVTFFRKERGETKSYFYTLPVEGGGKWKSFVLEAGVFHTADGSALNHFCGGSALQLTEAEQKLFIVNNLLWM
ncbi:MAG: hypothetical protein J6Z36_00800 [Clostridia bacterium]|nr:hypothetical protein [Clostridia bacterium]